MIGRAGTLRREVDDDRAAGNRRAVGIASGGRGMSAHDRVGSESRARVAADLVLLGGRLALERFHHAQASGTRDGALTADADASIQEAVGREIARAFPGDALVGDEGPFGRRSRDARYGWVL